MTSRGLYTDEHAEFERPRRRTRPRTKDHPDYSAAAIGVVITVDRGRYRLVVDDREVVATKARQLGRTGVIVGGGQVGLGQAEQRGQPGVEPGHQDAVDHPGPRRGIGEGGDDHQLVGVGHDRSLVRVVVVCRTA